MNNHGSVTEIGQNAAYVHEPLPSDPPTIRVLNLIPTSSHDLPIQLTLKQIRLTDDYNCLSHMWGDDKDQEVIFINNKRFEVRRNLYEFLCLARKLSITDTLWIDAICINQEDIQERNKQVQLMGDIYEKASQVLIYPGPLPKGLRDLSFWKRNPPGVSLPDIDAMPYWRRTWIVQEILLASKAFVVTGEGLIKWSAFSKRFPWSGYISRLETHASGYKKARDRDESLGYMLDQFSDTQCSDIRDRVYAMRALIPEYADVAVDYSEDEAAMLIRVSTECVLRKMEHVDHDGGVWILGQHVQGLRRALGVSIDIICATCFQGLPRTDQEVLWDVDGAAQQLTGEHVLIKATKTPESNMIGDIRVHDHMCGRCGRRRSGTRLEILARGRHAVWVRIPKVGFKDHLWGRRG